MNEVIGNYIKGTQINKTQGNYQDVFNPAMGNVRAKVCMSTKVEVDEAKIGSKRYQKYPDRSR